MLHKNFHPGTLAVWRFLFRREALGGLRFAHGVSFGEDVDFLFRVFRQAPAGWHLPMNLYCYVQMGGSITRTPPDIAKMEALRWLVRRLAETYADKPETLGLLRRKLLAKIVTVTYKQRKEMRPEVAARFRAVVAGLFAEGYLRLSAFRPRWQLRLLPMWWAGRVGRGKGWR